ncbi:MAG TPA: alternate F1F0 ATPase, F1 subunit alpha [Gammaproteobacteria bacterium]|nr:alternate F1F0 ATPase, F1 subunit alpha [Gammaproteobacteria bacterium]
MLDDLPRQTREAVDRALTGHPARLCTEEVGTVTRVGSGIAEVTGLPGVQFEELVAFPGDLLGLAVNLDPDRVGVILLGSGEAVVPGSEVRRTGRLADTAVGEAVLGRVFDATGTVRDGGPPLEPAERRPVEREAPAIMDRAPVAVPLQTGIKSVDALTPIGRGQRELIVGDRQTGKTAVAVDAILNQADTGVVCIYCAVGQRGTAVARVVDRLREQGALAYTAVVVAAGEDAPGLQYLTPYAATTLAEWFMERGRDVLLVYDDLTRHARVYRELSLLLRRPPGREAYPGDIFYIHSRLLERATHLRDEAGGGSLTALPVVETQAEDISAYIPTNLISITDGQIYLSPTLYRRGVLPAVDVGRSVSRVGGKAQLPAYRAVAGELRLAYSQFEELETFARFATRLDEETRATIERGRRVREVLKQAEASPWPAAEQIAVLKAVNDGWLDDRKLEEVREAEQAIRRAVAAELGEVAAKLAAGEALADADWAAMDRAIRGALAEDGQ